MKTRFQITEFCKCFLNSLFVLALCQALGLARNETTTLLERASLRGRGPASGAEEPQEGVRGRLRAGGV